MTLSRRAFWKLGAATSWEELWDASQYFDRVAELLEDARQWVLIVGWQLDSRLPLLRPNRQDPTQRSPLETLREKVLRLCQERPELKFYLLLWDHPSFYIPQREWLQTRVWEELHPNVHLVFDNRHPFGASHHEKLVAVDGRVVMTGGIDLCADRWDTPQHLVKDCRRSLDLHHESYGPYHELGVQVTGPICSLLQQHIRRRWRLLSSIPFPDSDESGAAHETDSAHHVWISRTRSSVDPGEAHRPIIREVEFLFLQLIAEARQQIWMEGQYFWSRHVQQALLEKIRTAGAPLRITLILADLSHLKFMPARLSWYQAHLLADLQRAALASKGMVDFRVYRPSSRARPIYVHSKLILIDEKYLSIGSANFSARALRMDSELMLTLEARQEGERAHLRRFLQELERHWRETTLYPVDSVTEEWIASRKSPLLNRIAWQKSVDPEIPYFHRFKRRLFYKLEKRATRLFARFVMLTLSWSLGFLPVTALLARKSAELGASGWILTALLFSVWIIPVPYMALVLITSLQFDRELASLMVVASWWMAGVTVTLWGRTFPTILRHWTDRYSPRPILAFGKRRFSMMLRAWADPRHTVHEKLLWQSRYWTPVPWMLLVNGLVIASALTWIVRWISELFYP